MVTTRSKTSQTHIEDFQSGKSPSAKKQTKVKKETPKPAKNAAKSDVKESSTKRKEQSEEAATPNKRAKASSKQVDSSESQTIIINRAPVLQLWAASVAHFIYPDLSWETCLSAGSAVSTICAVAKGRSIGTVAEADGSSEKQHKKKEAIEKTKDLDIIEVMQFKLKLKDGLALVGSEGKGKPGGEQGLKAKFGEKQYEAVKAEFKEALESWKGDEDDLNKEAFGFYESFRPDVKAGQKGWGRKGELKLDKVKEVISR